MGVVYKVRHTALETILALKVLPAYSMENEDNSGPFHARSASGGAP